jgi:hypothetical protein
MKRRDTHIDYLLDRLHDPRVKRIMGLLEFASQ